MRAVVATAMLGAPAFADEPTPTSTPAPTPGTPAPTPASPDSGAPPPSTPTAPVLGRKSTQPAEPSTKPTKETSIDKPVVVDEDPAPKLSLPTQADRDAWQKDGFRLQLELVYGQLVGLRGAPTGSLIGPKLRAGLRLDADWSILLSFEYALARNDSAAELGGLRFSGTIDPTWHITPAFSLGVGFGFGGIAEAGRDRMNPTPTADSLETSYTFPDASTPLRDCSGVGATALVRAEYALVLGPRSAVHAAAETIGQWTGCVEDARRTEPDTGDAIVRRQWWPHVGATLSIGVTWR